MERVHRTLKGTILKISKGEQYRYPRVTDWSVQLPGLYGRYYFVKVLWLHNVVIKSCYMFLMCLKSSEEESKVGQLVS